MNMKKLRKKHNLYRCLKAVSYLLGFPLFIVLVIVGSMAMFGGSAFSDIKWNGVLACVVLWVVSIIVQILISLITKNYNARTLIVLLVSVVLVIGGAVLCDLVVAKKYDEIAEEYSAYGIELNTYKYDVGWVSTWTTGKTGVARDYASDVDDFLRIYNIEYKSSNYGAYNANKNDDIANYRATHDGSKEGMTDADFVLSKITYDKDADAYYSVNGMYADGYIFGYKQALEVLINYNQAKFDIEHDRVETKDADGNVTVTYKPNGKSADAVADKALAALNSDPDWLSYKNSKEWQDVYGKGGLAANYSLSVDVKKLDKILSALGSGLVDSSIFSLLSKFVDIDGLISSVGLSLNDVKTLSVKKLLEIANDLLGGLADNEGLAATLADFGIDLSKPLTEDVLLDVLANFSFYQYPTIKPKFSFIKDETVRRFAEARYYAEEHGANVGSVLVSSNGGNIGHVVMGGGGYTPEYAYSLEQLYSLKARGEMSQYYPYMIARKYGYICGGIIAVVTVLFYLNKRKEDEVFEIIANGGRR